MAENNENLAMYELGYHLLPELDETEMRGEVSKAEQYITSNGGTVIGMKDPKRTHLSYPVKHKKYALFGTIDFKAEPEIVENLTKELKLNDKVMRFVILKHDENEKVLRNVGPAKTRTRTKPQQPKQEAAKSEEIEKQIDEVIKNI